MCQFVRDDRVRHCTPATSLDRSGRFGRGFTLVELWSYRDHWDLGGTAAASDPSGARGLGVRNAQQYEEHRARAAKLQRYEKDIAGRHTIPTEKQLISERAERYRAAPG